MSAQQILLDILLNIRHFASLQLSQINFESITHNVLAGTEKAGRCRTAQPPAVGLHSGDKYLHMLW